MSRKIKRRPAVLLLSFFSFSAAAANAMVVVVAAVAATATALLVVLFVVVKMVVLLSDLSEILFVVELIGLCGQLSSPEPSEERSCPSDVSSEPVDLEAVDVAEVDEPFRL